ncbi:hypothetical protein M0805_004544 [Coniferiporia weirii]|nr:hypothetical protein M0805_004544 [Coniferiporia weirii]
MGATTAATGLLSVFVLATAASISATRAPNDNTLLKDSKNRALESNGVIYLPLERRERKRRGEIVRRGKADKDIHSIGLGDALDITYNVVVQIGKISTPLVLDTGSADLWVLSDNCTSCTSSRAAEEHLEFYPAGDLKAVAGAELLYGDSRTGTQAYGVISSDKAGVAGFSIENQFFVAIGDTNTSVFDTGSAGIFGLGFPVNSVLWNEMYNLTSSKEYTPRNRRLVLHQRDTHSRSRPFPTLHSFTRPRSLVTYADRRNVSKIDSARDGVDMLSSFATYGPLVSRLALAGNISTPEYARLLLPQFSVTLERTIPSIGGNIGALTLGGLPPRISNESLAWSPVRLYTPEQNGVVVPEADGETYPYAWDVPIEGVYFDGVRLADSILGDVTLADVGTSALVDTGNSLIRGPADVVATILALLLNSTSSTSTSLSPSAAAEFTGNFDAYAYTYPCAQPHTLAFQFAGQRFAIDPRDFGRQAFVGDSHWCLPNIVPTDAPELGGFLYSWSLGEPFLKGVLSSFYYGNITYPSVDPPRIGFLSTVPDDAPLRLSTAVDAAEDGSGFPETTIAAPMGTFTGLAVTTDAHGVVQASEAPLSFSSDGGDCDSAGSSFCSGASARRDGAQRSLAVAVILGAAVALARRFT